MENQRGDFKLHGLNEKDAQVWKEGESGLEILLVTTWDVDKKPHFMAISKDGYECVGWRKMVEAISRLEKEVGEGYYWD